MRIGKRQGKAGVCPMNTILLFGEAQDHTLRNALLPALERYGGVLYAGERQIFRLTTEKPAFFVYDLSLIHISFSSGGVFGVAGLFQNSSEYVSDVQAIRRSRVLFLPEELLRSLFRREPMTAENYIAYLTTRICFLDVYKRQCRTESNSV